MAGKILAAQDRGPTIWLQWHADTTKTVPVQTGTDGQGAPVFEQRPDPQYVMEYQWERQPGETMPVWSARARAEARARGQRRVALIAASAPPPSSITALVGVDP